MEEAIRQDYLKAVDEQNRVPLYAHGWWLDATCGRDGWNTVSLNVSHGSIYVPYQYSRIRRMHAISNPPFTQFLPIIKTGQINEVSPDRLFQSLPAYAILDITLKPDPVMIENTSFPRAQLRYSYVIDSKEGLDILRSKYNEGLRRNLKEAAKKYEIRISDDAGTFISLCSATYEARGLKAPAWLASVLPHVVTALLSHQKGMLKMAWHDGQAVAGVLSGWDDSMQYYLAGGRIKTEAGASAHALLLDDAIADASVHNRSFDFEGSMHPGIANFFQSFGGKPQSLWRIRHYKGPGKIWSLFHP